MRPNRTVVDNPFRKPLKQLFLFLAILTYIPFGLLVHLFKDSTFDAVTASPLGILLLVLGGIAPTVAAVLVFLCNKDMGGFAGLKKAVLAPGKLSAWFMGFYFFMIHFGFAFLTGRVARVGSMLDFLAFFPLMFVTFGLQEICWRLIMHDEFLHSRGFWKMTICVGMIAALWALPLSLIPGSPLPANAYLPFAIYLVGLALMLSTMRMQGASMLVCIVFATLFFGMQFLLPMKMESNLWFLTIVDIVLAFIFKSKIFKENRKDENLLNP